MEWAWIGIELEMVVGPVAVQAARHGVRHEQGLVGMKARYRSGHGDGYGGVHGSWEWRGGETGQ